MWKALAVFSAIALVVGLAGSAIAGEFFIHDGDRVVFLGDSITEQRLYTTYIEAYALTRHPDWSLSFRNVGWSADTSWLRQRAHPDEDRLFAADEASQQNTVEDAVRRGLGRDVLPLKPTLVTIKFGMNDHSYQSFREDIFRAYVRSQRELARFLQASGARVAFLTPQPIEENRPDPDQDVRNQSLRRFNNGLKDVAAQSHAAFADQFDPYMAIMLRERAADPKASIGGGDAVHPGPAGHTIMAWAVLKGLGASALVSRAEIDWKRRKISSLQSCRVSALKVDGATISFDRIDDALPMPIDPKAGPALKIAPILEDLDRYELRITGLPDGDFELTIDGEAAGRATAGELGRGWNLALNAGPVTAQADEVLKLVFRKNDLFFDRWRNVQLFDLPAWAAGPEIEARRTAELARLDGKIAEVEQQIDARRKPKLHRFVIRRVAK